MIAAASKRGRSSKLFVRQPRLEYPGPVRKFAFNYPLLWLALWTALILSGDFVVLNTSARQLRSTHFASTTGRIIQSSIGRGAMMRRGFDVNYEFSVNGVVYVGRRYRYDDRNASFRYADATNAFPARTAHTVYYNSADPGDCLLDPGLDGCDLLLLLFALPLNVVTIAIWAAVFQARRERRPPGLAGGIRILQRPEEIRARLADYSPLAAGSYGLAAAAFVAVFPVVTMGGFAPSLRLMGAVWILVLATGSAAFAWAARGHYAGRFDLRIHSSAQTVTVPQTDGRAAPLTVPRREIVGVSMLRRVTRSPSGDHFTYVPALNRAANSGPQPLKLVTWGWSEKRARVFSQWLSDQLQVEFKGIESEPPSGASR
jgi:hypothetical protein